MKNGYDISEFQTGVNWPEVRTDFVIIRAHSGYRKDKEFDSHWAGAKGVGIPRSAYQYVVADLPISQQFDDFVKAVGGDKGELPPMMDWEDQTWKKVPQATRISMGLEWLNSATQWYGSPAILYTYPSFMSGLLGNDPRLKQFPLSWSNLGNDVLPPWPLTFRQYVIANALGFPDPIDQNSCDDVKLDNLLNTGKDDFDMPADPQVVESLQQIAAFLGNAAKPSSVTDIRATLINIGKELAGIQSDIHDIKTKLQA